MFYYPRSSALVSFLIIKLKSTINLPILNNIPSMKPQLVRAQVSVMYSQINNHIFAIYENHGLLKANLTKQILKKLSTFNTTVPAPRA